MAEATKSSSLDAKTVAVLLVTDGGDPPEVQAGSNYKPHRARYTKSMLRSTLQLMGCKPRTAHKVSHNPFFPETHQKLYCCVPACGLVTASG